jgi:tetratricopeptide (TPR) repeat protein
MQLSAIEKALLTGSWDASIPSGAVADLAKQVVDGDYLGVLTSEVAKRVLVASTTTSDITSWDQLLRLNEDDETTVLVLAVAALHGFLQQNWTGPDLPIAPSSIFSTTSGITISDEKLNALAVSELAAGGEPAYHLAQHPFLLRLSQLLLSLPFKQLASVPWWRLRFANVHIQILDEPVPPPPSILEGLAALHDSLPTVDPDLNGALLLEEGLLQHRLGDGKAAAPLFVQAARATGLRYELTGALGKRTKFQQTDVTQLVLLAESRRRESDAANSSNDNDGGDHVQEAPEAPLAPSTLDLNDDTLLERTQFTSSSISAAKPDPDEIDASTLPHIDPNAQPALHPLDSSILLALCLNLRNTSPSDGLTTEQMSPFVSRALTHARNWSVHTLGLLLRSRLEAHRTRTVERSVLQLQALVDQMKVDASDVTVAPVTERLRYIHALALPSKWEMERELATRLLSLGVVRSALEIFERLEMWEEAVGCHQALGKREQGVKVVKELLEGARMEADEAIKRERWNLAATENEGQEGEADEADVEEANKALKRRERLDTARAAKLWCLLGDLEPSNAAQHYTHAWTLSGHTSGRATRSLGGLHFASGQYALAIPCLRAAVAINPLLSRSWFILGCACTREEDWEGAREAFTRCVAIDDTDAESWNNLASAYLRLATSDTKVIYN